MSPPRRPRSHIISEQSFRSYCDVLPDNWVLREQRPDYAIDVQVQVFDGDLATPIFFFAQLKATDSPRIVDGVLRYEFDTDDLFHWAGFDAPVMLAVFDAAKREYFYEWVSRIFAIASPEKIRAWRFQKTATVSLPHRLEPATGPRVRAEAEHGLRHLGSRTSLAREFVIRLSGEDTSLVDKVREDLSRWLYHAGVGVVRVRACDEGDASIHVSAGDASLRLEYLGLNLRFAFGARHDSDRLTALSRTLTCALLALAGHAKHSTTLLCDLISSEEVFRREALGYLMSPLGVSVFSQADRRLEGLSVAEGLAKSGEANAALMLATGCRQGARSELVEQRVRHVLEILLQRGQDDNVYLGTMHYNVANSLHSSGQHRAAVRGYLKAVECSPEYASRSYWWLEFGGSLYLSGRVRLAEFAYRRARDLDPGDVLVSALIGDTIFVRGGFEAAAELYDEYLRGAVEPRAEYVLKAWLAPVLFEMFGDVRRQPALALSKAKSAYQETDDVRQYDALADALRLDPLCDFAWWNFAVGSVLRGADGLTSWGMAALIAPWDLAAVVNAVGFAVHSEQGEGGVLALALVYEATRNHGDEAVLTALAKHVRGDSKDALRDAALLVSSAKQAFEHPPERLTIRTLSM